MTISQLSEKCPICNNAFSSDACPHSREDIQRHAFEKFIRAVVRDELAKANEKESARFQGQNRKQRRRKR